MIQTNLFEQGLEFYSTLVIKRTFVKTTTALLNWGNLLLSKDHLTFTDIFVTTGGGRRGRTVPLASSR